MKVSKKTLWNLLILFEIIFIIKAVIALLIEGPFIFSDEPCVIQRAIYFANNLRLEDCEVITTLPGGNPQPLYSILIAPIYRFLYGVKAYQAILVFNSFLVSTLIFPLYHIFKKFIEKDKIIFINIAILLFLPQVTLFEKTVMTETLFIVISIWFLHFYLNSFAHDKNKRRNKIIAVILSILAVITRPFGFIIPISMTINELIRTKNKKYSILVLVPLAIGLTALTLIIMPGITEALITRIQTLNELQSWKYIATALTTQLNSFTIASYFIPMIIFFTYINKKDSNDLQNIKFFLLSFIILNFLISAQHIFGYLIEDNNPYLLTRYINVSIIFIFLFSFIFFQRYKKFSFNKSNTILAAILIISVFFFKDEGVKHTLNLELSIFHHARIHLFQKDIVESRHILGTYFLPLVTVLSLLLMKNKRKILTTAFLTIIITHSILSTVWISNFIIKNPLVELLENSEDDISLIVDNEATADTSPIWLLYSLTKTKPHLILIEHHDEKKDVPIKKELFNYSEFFKKSKYVITTYKSDLSLLFSMNDLNIYLNSPEQEQNET